ncbi:MAG: septum site-determining protein MinC [Thermoanaerobacteraceae bacterium]|nr:septum site-determining protein MinC [Thermoanaerobacteraceae bacterium]
MSRVDIRGTRNRLIISIDENEAFADAYNDLVDRLERSSNFFKGSQMKAVVKGKEMNHSERNMMRELLEARYGFKTLFLNPTEQKNDESVKFIKGTVRSGQVIETSGHVVVLGDANDGSEIKAGGNILIMGRTNGLLHAGYPDRNDAIIAAFRMESLQIRIGNIISRAPDRKRYRADVPEIAYIKDEKIVIEPLNQKSKML